MLTVRVSNLASYARWKEDEDSDIPALIAMIRGGEESEAMRKGTAFHKALELATEGQEMETVTQDGYTFAFTLDESLWLPPAREQRREKDYGGIIVTGQTDALIARTIYDHKTTEKFDAERYLEGWQWKYYLDIFDADRFIWNVFECKEMDEPKTYCVHTLNRLEAYRYERMRDDCTDLAREFKQFAQGTLGWT